MIDRNVRIYGRRVRRLVWRRCSAWGLLVTIALTLLPTIVRGQVTKTASNARPRAGEVTADGLTSRPTDSTTAVAPRANDGAAGGASGADFDQLIDLVEATIAPDTWETVGGNGTINGFPGGVYVDTRGVLRNLPPAARSRFAQNWQRAAEASRSTIAHRDVDRPSVERKVSLRRLQAAWLRRDEQSAAAREEMLHVAGLERIDRVWLAADPQDVIIAGPAAGWTVDSQGRHVSRETGRPVLRWEDWAILVRDRQQNDGQFVCAITPTQAGLVAAQQYVLRAAAQPLPDGKRAAYRKGLSEALGLQRVDIQGLDSHSRVARVLIEADYHMKQIGIGLEPGTDGLTSYLDRLVEDRRAPAGIDVVRWWFTLSDDCLQRGATADEFELADQTVRVLSENELLSARGERIHTGQSDPLNAQFAREFTQSFSALAAKYPIYADLDNVFRWAIVAALAQSQEQAGTREPVASAATAESTWSPDPLADHETEWLRTGRAPQWVASLVNDRDLDARQFIAVVSGGVEFNPARVKVGPALTAAASTTAPPTGQPATGSAPAAPVDGTTPDSADPWWWD